MIIDVYVDGSFDACNASITHGGVLITHDGKVLCGQRLYSKDKVYTEMRNVGGELIAAMQGVVLTTQLLQEAGYDMKADRCAINIHYDYNGIEKWATNQWAANKAGTRTYKLFINEFKKTFPGVLINFVKVKAHSGVLYNETVDAIAKGTCRELINAKLLSTIEFGGR